MTNLIFETRKVDETTNRIVSNDFGNTSFRTSDILEYRQTIKSGDVGGSFDILAKYQIDPVKVSFINIAMLKANQNDNFVNDLPFKFSLNIGTLSIGDFSQFSLLNIENLTTDSILLFYQSLSSESDSDYSLQIQIGLK